LFFCLFAFLFAAVVAFDRWVPALACAERRSRGDRGGQSACSRVCPCFAVFFFFSFTRFIVHVCARATKRKGSNTPAQSRAHRHRQRRTKAPEQTAQESGARPCAVSTVENVRKKKTTTKQKEIQNKKEKSLSSIQIGRRIIAHRSRGSLQREQRGRRTFVCVCDSKARNG
jgi:hypothetical protein